MAKTSSGSKKEEIKKRTKVICFKKNKNGAHRPITKIVPSDKIEDFFTSK